MKKYLTALLILCVLCVIFVSGCAGKTPSQTAGNKTKENARSSTGEPDSDFVDLTLLSDTMVFAEVYNMVLNPDDYMGKTIKISGNYYTSYYNDTGLNYHLIVVGDATSCCQQWLEFIWSGDHTYPDDYPDIQTKIELVGVFGTYNELGETYCYLTVDDISVLQ